MSTTYWFASFETQSEMKGHRVVRLKDTENPVEASRKITELIQESLDKDVAFYLREFYQLPWPESEEQNES